MYERGVRKGGGGEREEEGREEREREVKEGKEKERVLGLSQSAPQGSKCNSSNNGVTLVEEGTLISYISQLSASS